MEQLKPPVRWLKAHWDEEDVLYFFEADEDGWVLRQVELCGPDRAPTVAAALSEWPDANREGIDAVRAYEAKDGGLSERPITEWDPGFPGVEIDRAEFEETWHRARAHLDANRP
jgi:hypothetical protein